MAPEHVAAAVVLLAALIGLLANPVARWLARGDADLDRLVSDALDERDFDGNVVAFDRMGRTR